MKTLLAVVIAFASVTAAQPGHAVPPDRDEDAFTVVDQIDCSAFDPDWVFVDEFVDEFRVRRTFMYDAAGNLVRIVEHWSQTSTDVNSVTGVTITEHNRFVATGDFTTGTVTINGALNSAQRPGVGSVILTAGHKVYEFDLAADPPLGLLLTNRGPDRRSDEDFCRAIA